MGPFLEFAVVVVAVVVAWVRAADAAVEVAADQTVMAGTVPESVAVAERAVAVWDSRHDRTAGAIEPGVAERE